MTIVVLNKLAEISAKLIRVSVHEPDQLDHEIVTARQLFSDWLPKQGLSFTAQAEAKEELLKRIDNIISYDQQNLQFNQ